MFKTLIVWVLNFVIGIIGTSILVTKIMGTGQGVSATSNSASIGIKLDTTGFIVWAVVVIAYFVGARKVWGKTVGGLIADAVMGKKK